MTTDRFNRFVARRTVDDLEATFRFIHGYGLEDTHSDSILDDSFGDDDPDRERDARLSWVRGFLAATGRELYGWSTDEGPAVVISSGMVGDL